MNTTTSLTEQKESLSRMLDNVTRRKLVASWSTVDGKLVCKWISE